jgi:hypothetical protein
MLWRSSICSCTLTRFSFAFKDRKIDQTLLVSAIICKQLFAFRSNLHNSIIAAMLIWTNNSLPSATAFYRREEKQVVFAPTATLFLFLPLKPKMVAIFGLDLANASRERQTLENGHKNTEGRYALKNICIRP